METLCFIYVKKNHGSHNLGPKYRLKRFVSKYMIQDGKFSLKTLGYPDLKSTLNLRVLNIQDLLTIISVRRTQKF